MATRAKLFNWQPMKTAPTDGTPILLLCNDYGASYKIVVGYRRHWQGEEWFKTNETTQKLRKGRKQSDWSLWKTTWTVFPTHWAPYVDFEPPETTPWRKRDLLPNS